MIEFLFNERKATQAASLIIQWAGGRMEYLKLLKLMYLADRVAISDRGFSITGDAFYSMPHGPVLTNVYDAIGGKKNSDYWHNCMQTENYEVSLLDPSGSDELSRKEIDILRGVHSKYGGWDKWKLRDFTHTLPEWDDPDGSSDRIPVERILEAEGWSAKDIEELEEEINIAKSLASI